MHSTCPFCDQTVPFSELQRHANSHFEDDEREKQVARDLELAQQIAFSPPSSSSFMNSHVIYDMLSEETSDSRTLRCEDRILDNRECSVDEKACCLIGLQNRSTFYKIEAGLTTLLRHRLELESDNSTSIISGYIDHYQSIRSEDSGWGCGWRNIQMLSSHLLMQRQEAREVLFGGSGFVPDIPSLQRWLEIAWERGFDVHGSDHFDRKIYGKRHWIGATECAALFRSFGLRAKIVDFCPMESQDLYLSVPGSIKGAEIVKFNDRGKRKAFRVYGPMDKYLLSRDASQAGSSGNGKLKFCDVQVGGTLSSQKGDNMANTFATRNKGCQVLIDWVWNYFSDKKLANFGDRCVFISDKSPLYFQHDGHSRTIVGIQVKHQQSGMPQYNLLILDPAHRTEALESSLKENIGWQKLMKRGLHTLKQPQYQLCYIDSGLAAEAEMERLKIIDSIFIEL